MTISADILQTFPVVDEEAIDRQLNELIKADETTFIVLDDDPTGVQTVHDISVFTDWTEESIREGLREGKKLFYILTNSRGFTMAQTEAAHKEIAANVGRVAREEGRKYLFISRSDSTLRGHYPLETEILKTCFEESENCRIDGEILCPFFKEGGRFTIDNIHYVKYGDKLVSANETEFARDKTFGYTALTMPEYIEEKTAGAYKAEDVTCISLKDLREQNIEKITRQLLDVADFNKVVVNAADDVDVKIFCIALYKAMEAGKLFMFRTAAAFVRAVGGVTREPLLTGKQMIRGGNTCGGVIVIGSHTEKTTAQLEELKKLDSIQFIEMNANLVKDESAMQEEVERCLKEEEQCLRAGKSVCCYTTRALITADTGNKEDELILSTRISEAVQSLVQKLTVTPSFIIAKGGITSSDVGVKALQVKKANVLGQIEPGIPVWETGKESRFPGIPYIIFPGNVGDADTLRKAVEKLLP